MIKQLKPLFYLLLLGGLVSSCYYDNKECLYPEAEACDTTNISYSAFVWPVINESCTGCHSGSAPAGNITLDNYTSIAAAGNIESGQYGSLYGTISHDPGNSPMPQGESQLPSCTIQKIKAWIDAGTPNN